MSFCNSWNEFDIKAILFMLDKLKMWDLLAEYSTAKLALPIYCR